MAGSAYKVKELLSLAHALYCGFAALCVCGTMFTAVQAEEANVKSFGGELPGGAGAYLVAAPLDWNGILLLDIDYASPHYADSEMYKRLYALGYAGAGSTRGPPQEFGTPVDTPERIERQLKVLDIFEEKFGKPKQVIAYGRSAAGALVAAMAETASDRIDGAVGGCFVTGVIGWLNSNLDSAFAAKALIAPNSELLLQRIPHELTGAAAAWTKTLKAAQATPEGRARIALAAAIGQLPMWSNATKAEPDPADISGLQVSMFETLLKQFEIPVSAFRVRRDFEESAGGAVSWNTETDYRKLHATRATKLQKRVVADLYRSARLDLKADVARINATPRITADATAVQEANRRLGLKAQPKKPVLIFQLSGDPVSIFATLDAYVAKASKELVRLTVVRGAGHCAFSVSENLAAISTMTERLAKGTWPDTSSAAMNARASVLDTSTARFSNFELVPFSHPFYLEDVYVR
jgi:pimeloyl-ACP methyl ester carboxylesterase